MIAVRRKEWFRYLALVQSESLLLEFLYCLSSLYPRQVATPHARTFIVGQSARHVGEVGPTNQDLIYRISLKRCDPLLLGISLLRESHKNVLRMHHSTFGIDSCLCLLVNITRLALYVVVVNERRAYLLVAIHEKFLAECGCSVNASLLGCNDLKLVVDKQVDIFFYAFSVYRGFSSILVVGILKLRPCDVLATDGHYYRVGGLGKSAACRERQSNQQCFYLHLVNTDVIRRICVIFKPVKAMVRAVV